MSRVGGDRAVHFRDDSRILDAHRRDAGDFTEARTVDGESVYLTKEGATAFDRWLAEGFEPEVISDHVIKDQLFGHLPWRAELVNNPELEGLQQRHSGSRY